MSRVLMPKITENHLRALRLHERGLSDDEGAHALDMTRTWFNILKNEALDFRRVLNAAAAEGGDMLDALDQVTRVVSAERPRRPREPRHTDPPVAALVA